MKSTRSLLSAALLAGLAPVSFGITVPVAADTFSTPANQLSAANGKASTLLVTRKTPAFVRFDLGLAAVPLSIQGNNIVSANVRVYLSKVASPTTLSLHRLTSPFTEKGGVAPTFDPTPIASVTAAEQKGKTSVVFDVTSYLIPALVSGDNGLAIVVTDAAKISIPSKESALPACEMNIETNYAENSASVNTGTLNATTVVVTGDVTGGTLTTTGGVSAGTLAATGNTTIGGTLTVTGNTTFNNNVTIAGNKALTISGTGSIGVGGNINSSSDITANQNLRANQNLSAAGNLTLGGSASRFALNTSVGAGTASILRNLAGEVVTQVYQTSGGTTYAQFQDPASSGASLFLFNGVGAQPGGGSWANSSDRRLKKNIEPLSGALNRLMKLRSVTFEYRDPAAIHEPTGTQIGFIAQEVEPFFPNWVGEKADGMKFLAIKGFESLTVQALRELRTEKDAEIAALKQQVAALEARDSAREERLSRLEESVSDAPVRTARAPRARKAALVSTRGL